MVDVEPGRGFLLTRALRGYVQAYRGLAPQTWRLTLGCFVQRSGTMVLPFLTLYLSKERDMSESQAATILLCHGLGAIMGSLLATQTLRWLTTRSNIVASLLASAAAIFILYHVESFFQLALWAGLLSLVEAPFRPAIMTEVSLAEAPENQARAVALLRLGVNAGMMLGPALGGWLALRSYGYLFYVDAGTCLLAAIFLVLIPTTKPAVSGTQDANPLAATGPSPMRDRVFLLIWLAQFAQFLVIFQLVSTVPLYLTSMRQFVESDVGVYFLLNGLMIIVLEMWLVNRVQRFSAAIVFGMGAFVMALGIAALHWASSAWMIYGTVLVWTLGEMVSMPLLHTLAIRRAKARAGSYMAWFSAATNVAMVVAAPAGLWLVHHYGYGVLWASIAGVGGICLALGLCIHKRLLPRAAIAVLCLVIMTTSSCRRSTSQAPRSPTSQNCPQLRAQLQLLLRAVESRDLPGLGKLMHPSGRMQLSLPDTPTSYASADFLEFHRGFFAAPSWTMRHHVVQVECGPSLGHAYVEAVYHEPDRDGQPYYNHIGITYVFEKTQGRWYPISDHASWIRQGSTPPKVGTDAK